MDIESQFDNESACIEREYEEGIIDGAEYESRMAELEEDFRFEEKREELNG